MKNRSGFTNARMESGESLRIFVTRLEKAFRIAYLSHLSKRVEFIPNYFHKQLDNARSLSLAMNNKELSWTNILSLASRFD